MAETPCAVHAGDVGSAQQKELVGDVVFHMHPDPFNTAKHVRAG